jgi:hypothetical protein
LRIIFQIAAILMAIYIFIAISFDVPRPIASVIVPLNATGGLGNQMFRYAAGYALAKKTGSKLYIMISDRDGINKELTLSKFNIDENNIIYKNRLNRKLFKRTIVNEENFFDFYKKDNYHVLIIDDDFESDIFFKDVKADILKSFTPREIPDNIKALVEDVKKENSVCIHVRNANSGLECNRS